jgi:hypothetical protein
MARSRIRSMTYRAALAAFAAIGASSALNGCLIDERRVDEECFAFCSEVQEQCQDKYAVYPSHEACMAVCRELDRGTPGDTSAVNTLECRIQALHTGFDIASCRNVGAGGNGRCGNDCEAFCTLRAQACGDVEPEQPDVADHQACLVSCQRLPGSDVSATPVPVETDSLQCRLGYLSAALVSESAARDECASTRTELAADARCRDDSVPVSECTLYCSQVMSSCTGEYQVYDSQQQCEAVCSTFVPGAEGDVDQNTMYCRKYHAGPTAAALDPATHCIHAGPTGDGHCGAPDSGNCISYCTLLEQACDDGFDRQYPQGQPACIDACRRTLPDVTYEGLAKGSPFYSVANATQIDQQDIPTLACRVLHAVRAMAAPGDPVECAAALAEPGSPCE